MSETAIWVTNETPPRRMIVKGTAAVDRDVLVAEFEDGSTSVRGGKSFWIVKASGYVCGIQDKFDPANAVRARPASVDTHPKGGDSTEIEAPFMSGAVGDSRDAQTGDDA